MDKIEEGFMKQAVSIFLSAVLLICVVGSIPQLNTERVYADGYNGSTYESSSTELIEYHSKTDDESSIKGGLPKYSNGGTNYNTCANVAGATLLGYYDKDYGELIPAFDSARVIRDKILYSKQTSAVQTVIDELVVKMKTNQTGNGTTVNNFKNGLQLYVNEKGRNISYNSVMSSKRFNIEIYKKSIDNKQPVALFVSKYTMIPISDLKQNDQTDILRQDHFGGDHVLIGYGIREIRYFNKAGALMKQVTLLMAATGYKQTPLVYIKIDDRMQIIDGYNINIY